MNIRSIASIILILALCSCQKDTPSTAVKKNSGKKIFVVTTLFPLYDFARIICGDKAEVRLLLPPGVEAHSFEPKPADLVAINKADVFVYTNAAMEPWATKLLKGIAEPSLRIVDASRGATLLETGKDSSDGHESGKHDENGQENHAAGAHKHTGKSDPHLWLDFRNAAIMVDNVTAAVMEKDPVNAGYYQANATAYKAELLKLDNDFSTGLSRCDKRTFLHGGHYAFGYLAARYGLSYSSAKAVNPDAEPTPTTIAQLLKQVKSNGMKFVFTEELASPRTAEMIATEAGIKILTLHGAHNITKDDLTSGATFIGLMRRNLESLRIGLQCQ